MGNMREKTDKKTDPFYFAYNMHWEAQEFSLPVLPKGQRWEKIADTFYEEPWNVEDAQNQTVPDCVVQGRSIQIYMSVAYEKTTIR